MQLNSELSKHAICSQIYKHIVYKPNCNRPIYIYIYTFTYILGSYKLDVNHIVEFPD